MATKIKKIVKTKRPKQHYGNKAIRASTKKLEKLRKVR